MQTPRRATFPRSARVRTQAEYACVFERNKRTADPLLGLHYQAGAHTARLGLAVSRKVDGRAVARNRIKRVLRDTMRHLRPWLAPGDYVVVLRPGASKVPAQQLRATFVRVLQRAGTLPVLPADGTMPRSLHSLFPCPSPDDTVRQSPPAR